MASFPRTGWMLHETSVYLPGERRPDGPRPGDRLVVVVYGGERVPAAEKEAVAAAIRDFLNGPS
jgi:hypothetical protein